MTVQPKRKKASKSIPATEQAQQSGPCKPWGRKTSALPQYVQNSLYQVSHYLGKQTRQRVGLLMKIPVFVQDPHVARENPLLGVQEIEVRVDACLGDGPTSARIAIVDFDAGTQSPLKGVVWDGDVGWFRSPLQADGWLPDIPRKTARNHQRFIEQALCNPYFRQLNVWAVVQRVLEFYEDPQALGRPVPWGFDGNRLIVVPHAGPGNNAFYDRRSKSLHFYQFGDPQNPGYTCLSHDVIAHETGHAVLDGIRPRYNHATSIQTAAFHEFIGDLTAILLALDNQDIRHFIAEKTKGDLRAADLLANIAEQFGQEVAGRPYLRTAFNRRTMQEVEHSLTPHRVSEVLTGAMFDILIGIAKQCLEQGLPGEDGDPSASGESGAGDETGAGGEETAPGQQLLDRGISPVQALWQAAERFRRIALQPLDLCPPCDIQFIDYARAVLRNDILTNPVDEDGYREIMLSVFHERGLCDFNRRGAGKCAYRPGERLPADCQFRQAVRLERLDFVYHDIERVARSRTAAYYFLSDNRKVLRIPPHVDLTVADLYDNVKYGAEAERLPREVVLEYLWQEKVELKGLRFGEMDGKTASLDCGGTLVFDERGNLLSWFHKPGTEHLDAAVQEALRWRQEAWQNDPEEARRTKIKKLTRQERAELEDLRIGKERKEALLDYIADATRLGLVGDPCQPFSEGARPIAAVEEGGVVHFEITPHLRESDFEARVDE